MKNVIFKSHHNLSKLVTTVFRWHIRYYFLNKYSPMACGMYVTNKCNFRCEFCNFWRNPKLNTIPLTTYKQTIDDLKDVKCYYFSVSGGEPLLVKDIMERLTYAKARIPYVHFVTNGYLLSKEIARDLANTKIDEISISIDGLAETHDSVRGKQGAFEHALAAIENLKTFAPKINIVINSVLSPANVSDLYEVVKIVENLGLMHKFQPINNHPVFDKQKTTSVSYKSNMEDIAHVKEFTEFAKKRGNIANSNYFLSQISNFFTGKVEGGIFTDECLVGYHYCEIKEDAELYPCLTGMEWKNGFKLDKGFKEVFYSKEYKEQVNKLRNCKECQKNMYVCYFEPRITFPIKNYIKYNWFNKTLSD